MTAEQDTSKDHQNDETSQKISITDESQYARLANDSIRYIQTEKQYLLISIILPIFIIMCQIAIFVLVIVDYIRLNGTHPRPRPIFDILIPIITIVIFSVFLLIHLVYLLKWNSKVNNYIKHRKSLVIEQNNGQTESSSKAVPLSQIFYDIVNHMRNVRLIFYTLNAVSVLYLLLIVREILGTLSVIILRDFLFRIPWIIINTISFIAVVAYLAFQWKYYLQWNKKLEKLDEFERSVYDELGFE